MGEIPAEVWAVVSGNVVVQWAMMAFVIVLMTSSAAEKLKGPLGGLARWARSLGQERENREAEERRALRRQLMADAAGIGSQEFAELKAQVEELYRDRDYLARLVREHMGWDHDMQQRLIERGVRPGDIPTPPPLRVPWGTPSRVRSDKTLPGTAPSLT